MYTLCLLDLIFFSINSFSVWFGLLVQSLRRAWNSLWIAAEKLKGYTIDVTVSKYFKSLI